MDNELTEIYDRLRSAYETVEADLQSRIDANASAYSSYEQLRDTQGRYILLDALLQLAALKVQIVNMSQVDNR